MKGLPIVFVYFVVLVAVGFCENPIVTINNGKVMGISNQTVEGNTTYYAFRAIPYAKPPTGSLRFKAPQEADSWNGTLNGTIDGADCLQTSDGDVIGSEDCLFINVYTTDKNMNGSRSVIVWIHGGSFTVGSGSYARFRPDHLLDEEVIYVSLNYRLGPLGWLSTEDEHCPGNYGLKDQILGLKWVQKNIARFGGDPKNVTIFGQSAGSASVSLLLQSNLTEGLFKGAIMESGTSLNLWSLQTDPSNHAFKLGVEFGKVTFDSKTLVETLMDKDGKDIIKAGERVLYKVILNNILAGLPWAPVVEPWSNESAFSGKSHDLLLAGKFRKVPLIVGFNSNELGFLFEVQLALGLLLTNYDLNLAKITPVSVSSSTIQLLRAGTKIKIHYFGLLGTIGTQVPKAISFFNYDQFVRPIREFANLTSMHTQVYFYRFNHIGELGGTVSGRSFYGTSHGEEVNYIFVSDNNSTSQDTVVRKRMVKMWTNFAKYSSPRYSSDSALFSTRSTSEWKPARVSSTNGTLTDSSSLSYMNITSNLVMATNPNQTDYEFYRDEVFGAFGTGSFTTY